MQRNRRPCAGPHRLVAVLLLVATCLCNCTVYTIDKATLENKLKPKESTPKKGRALNHLLAMYKVQHNNHIDTLQCLNPLGELKLKRLTYDSKITIITTNKRSIRFYAKTLYIWNDEFLIGERSAPSLKKSNYFPVRLKDIARIEVKG